MTETLPEDWRDREDGFELLLGEFARAYAHDDEERLAEFMYVAGELAARGAVPGAWALLTVGASKVLGVPTESLAESFSDESVGRERLLLVVASSRTSKLTTEVLSAAASVERSRGRIEDARTYYEAAAASAGDPLTAARILQSLGVALWEAERADDAYAVTREAQERFLRLEDTRGWVETGLNLVEYDTADGRDDDARSRLAEMDSAIRGLRDPHLYGSYLTRVGLLEIQGGAAVTGRRKLHQALRSAERRADYEVQIACLSNLAAVARGNGDMNRALNYSERAYIAAEESATIRRIADTAHEFGIDLAKLDEFDEAVEMLTRAADTSRGRRRARVRADHGAVLTSRALAAGERSETRATKDIVGWLAESETLLLESLAELSDPLDVDWSLRILRNLRVVFLADDRPAAGTAVFDALLENVPAELKAECLRLSALLRMSAGNDAAGALNRFRSAAQLSGDDKELLLLEYASVAANSYASYETSLALYDDALALLPEGTIFGNALLDSALAAAQMGDTDDAIRRLQAASELASSRQDRVLGSLVELNLGRLLSGEDRFAEARVHLKRAAEFAEAIGDYERASKAYASWAVTLPNDQAVDGVEEAESLAARSLALARSDEDTARALSARASIQFARGEFKDASDTWAAARKIAPPVKQAVYDGFILQTLVHLEDWRTFRRKLHRAVGASQRTQTQLVLAEGLWPSANRWLLLGHVPRSAKVLACSILLANEGHRGETNQPPTESDTATRLSATVSTARAVAHAGQLLTMDVIPEELRQRLRPELEKALVAYGAEPDLSAEIVEFLVEFVRDVVDDR